MVIYIKKFFIVLISTLGITGIPSLIFGNSIGGYVLPFLYPPGFLFPVIWSILYVLMSVSVCLASRDNDDVFVIYYVNVVVNALWTVIFFGLRLKLFSFIWIVLLLGVTVYMLYKFYKYNRLSAYLLIPYVIWLIYAGYLNLGIYILN